MGLYVLNNKLLVRNGVLATAENCCDCGGPPLCGRCIRNGEWDCRYTTKLTCEDCIGTLTCYEARQTECDGDCPAGFTPGEPVRVEVHPALGCSGDYYYEPPPWGYTPSTAYAIATVGCGQILSVALDTAYHPHSLPFGWARWGRSAPTVTATVTQSGGSASGAVLAVNLTTLMDSCGFPIWYISSISVVSPGSGYTMFEPEGNAVVTIEDAPGDVQEFYGEFAYVSAVDENGGIVSVEVIDSSNRWHESAALPALTKPYTVYIGGGGSGAVVAPVIDTDTDSPDFGRITGFTVTNGGSGYLSLCTRNAPVASCDECPPRTLPEYADCVANPSSDGRPCGEWQSVSCKPCRCIYVMYEHPTWIVSETSMPERTVACPPIGYYGCDYIASTRYIPKPEIFSGLGVRVRITGGADDSIAIDGQVLGSCRHAGEVDHSFSLTDLQDGFELGAVDSFGSCLAMELTICFHEENPLP